MFPVRRRYGGTEIRPTKRAIIPHGVCLVGLKAPGVLEANVVELDSGNLEEETNLLAPRGCVEVKESPPSRRVGGVDGRHCLFTNGYVLAGVWDRVND